MISADVTEWRYFIADADSPATKKLNEAEEKSRQFAQELKSFQDALPADVQLVGFVEEGAWSPQIVQLGIETGTPGRVPGANWVESAKDGVYQAKKDTDFFRAQENLIHRMRQIPHLNFVWTLLDGGEEENNPSLGVVLKLVPGGEDNIPGEPETIHATIAEAFHFKGNWIFRVPVNPDNGKYYHPPGSQAVSVEELGCQLAGKRPEDLMEFSAARPFAKLKTYDRVLKYDAG